MHKTLFFGLPPLKRPFRGQNLGILKHGISGFITAQNRIYPAYDTVFGIFSILFQFYVLRKNASFNKNGNKAPAHATPPRQVSP